MTSFTPAPTMLDWLRARSHQQDRHRADNVYRARSKDGTDTMALVVHSDGEWSILTNRCVVYSTGEHRAVGTTDVMHATSARAALANYYTAADLEGLP
jgi:ABC-type Fe3+/spermidine/putrescine transport system ATPase subunit